LLLGFQMGIENIVELRPDKYRRIEIALEFFLKLNGRIF
jgi:hypothetical protein